MGQLLRDNIWAILAAIAALWGGYLTGTTTITLEIEQLKERTAKLEAWHDKDAAFHACATRHFDWLRSGAAPPAPCDLAGQ